ncbi:hypothetical protein BAE44_0025599 [Dichanthelium oligosanthes]|uniref:Uncharacterized protein n=1 Tax=Dichanthelium oligosanthes TaxID=888268 RepID=A0A1E5UKH7_9POAL|nr:hypothetical protein BAE44_0025599 [Dichanthelium oligosanthes]
MELLASRLKTITRITAAKEFIFAISRLGVCVAFRQTANGSIFPCQKDGRIWNINCHGELVKILFYNKTNDTIIIVSSMIATPGYVMRASTSIRFRSVINNVYEINNYTLVHSFARKIHSITTRPGVVIVAYEFGDYLPIEVLSTENWTVLKKFSYFIPPCKELEYIDIFKENIFLKEQGKNMKIVEIWNHDNVNVIEQTQHQKPLLGFDLSAKKLLLSNVGYKLSDTYVTKDKSCVIYSSRKSIEKPREDTDGCQASSIGSINVYSTFRGKVIANISPCNDFDLTVATRKRGDHKTTYRVVFTKLLRMSRRYFMMRSITKSILGTEEALFMCGQTNIGGPMFYNTTMYLEEPLSMLCFSILV